MISRVGLTGWHAKGVLLFLTFAVATGLTMVLAAEGARDPWAAERPASSEAPTTYSAAQLSERFGPGSNLGRQGRGNMSDDDLAAFTDFPLMWLGTDFAGYNLQSATRLKYDTPKGVPAFQAGNSVTFIYGTCARHLTEGAACPSTCTYIQGVTFP